jgi:quercetin dioxygenase-like cupin family protein
MDAQDFAAGLEAAGYIEIETKALDPRPANHGHAHDSSIRGLVLDGEFIVACEATPRSYRAGEIFEVPAGMSHTEAVGAAGAKIVVGRKY